MIITLTANPSLDRTATLDAPLARGQVQRVSGVTVEPGGKGVNVARAIHYAGHPVTAVLPAPASDPILAALRQLGVAYRTVEVAEGVRMNLTLTEPDGTTTKLNSPGATVTPAVLDAMSQAMISRAANAQWVVLAGSLPPGAPVGWYAELVTALRATPAKIAVDTSDAALSALVDALPGAAPDLMKPNGHELASFTGDDADELESDPTAAARAARYLVDRGVGTVLATLGGTGAVLVTADEAWFAPALPIDVVSTVGAGDSSLFGYLLGEVRGLSPAERLGLGVAYGSAAAGLPGTTIPTPSQTQPDLVRVSSLKLRPEQP